jgi:hypothetical protein
VGSDPVHPSITSMSLEGITVRSPMNLWPWMSTSTPLHSKAHQISLSGELVIMGIDRVVVGRESLFTNLEVTYDPGCASVEENQSSSTTN